MSFSWRKKNKDAFEDWLIRVRETLCTQATAQSHEGVIAGFGCALMSHVLTAYRVLGSGKSKDSGQ
jgi:hypothetical protein